MSTKIWEAYRVKPGHDIFDIALKIREKAEANAKKTLAMTYKWLLESWEGDHKFKKEALEFLGYKDKEKLTPLDASHYVKKQFGQQISKYEKDLFDLNVSVAIRKQGHKYYLIPYSGSGILKRCLDFMKKMPELEDFHYQNQVDAPKNIPYKEYRQRGKTWEPMLENWRHMLVLEIVSYNGFFDVDPGWNPQEYKKLTENKSIKSLMEVLNY